MEFSADLDKELIFDENNNPYSADEFKELIEHDANNGVFHAMTIMTSRFIRYGYNWQTLKDYYGEIV